MAMGYPEKATRGGSPEAEAKPLRQDIQWREAFMAPAAVKALEALEPRTLRIPPPRLPPLPPEIKIAANFNPVSRTAATVYWVAYETQEGGNDPAPEKVLPGDPFPYDVSGWVHDQSWYIGEGANWPMRQAGSILVAGHGGIPFTYVPEAGPEPGDQNYILGHGSSLAVPDGMASIASVWPVDYFWEGSWQTYPYTFVTDMWHRDTTEATQLGWIGPTNSETVRHVVPIVTFRERSEYLEIGYGSALEPRAADAIETTEDMHYERRRLSRSLDSVAVITSPAVRSEAGAKPSAPPTSHVMTPRTRERKFIANVRARSFIGKVVNFTTESLDMLTAVWEALPEKYRTGQVWSRRKNKWVQVYYPKPQEKAADLWKHWKEIDVNEAIKNIALNQLEDAAYGRLGAAQQKAARPLLEAIGKPVGLTTGPAL